MKFSREIWEEKRKAGLRRFLLIDGILFNGGPFAVVMQVIGVFLLRAEGQTVGQYFAATQTWIIFILHGVLFGLVVGFLNWKRGEAAYKNAAPDPE